MKKIIALILAVVIMTATLIPASAAVVDCNTTVSSIANTSNSIGIGDFSLKSTFINIMLRFIEALKNVLKVLGYVEPTTSDRIDSRYERIIVSGVIISGKEYHGCWYLDKNNEPAIVRFVTDNKQNIYSCILPSNWSNENVRWQVSDFNCLTFICNHQTISINYIDPFLSNRYISYFAQAELDALNAGATQPNWPGVLDMTAMIHSSVIIRQDGALAIRIVDMQGVKLNENHDNINDGEVYIYPIKCESGSYEFIY